MRHVRHACSCTQPAPRPVLLKGLLYFRTLLAPGPGLSRTLAYSGAWLTPGPSMLQGLACSKAWLAPGPDLLQGPACSRARLAGGGGWAVRPGTAPSQLAAIDICRRRQPPSPVGLSLGGSKWWGEGIRASRWRQPVEEKLPDV